MPPSLNSKILFDKSFPILRSRTPQPNSAPDVIIKIKSVHPANLSSPAEPGIDNFSLPDVNIDHIRFSRINTSIKPAYMKVE